MLSVSGHRDGRSKSWLLASALVLAASCTAGAAFLAAGLAFPQSGFGDLSPLSLAHSERAVLDLKGPVQTSTDLTSAVFETRTALTQDPFDDAAWLRLAYIDRCLHSRLSTEGLYYLRQSYIAAPYGPDTSFWRVRFALENWDTLSPDLRSLVLQEIKVQWPVRHDRYKPILMSIQNDQGRTAAIFIMRSLS